MEKADAGMSNENNKRGSTRWLGNIKDPAFQDLIKVAVVQWLRVWLFGIEIQNSNTSILLDKRWWAIYISLVF